MPDILDNGFWTYKECRYLFTVSEREIRLYPPCSIEKIDYDGQFIDINDIRMITLVGNMGLRGARWVHTACIEQYDYLNNGTYILYPKYIFRYFEGMEIHGLDIYGDAVDELFSLMHSQIFEDNSSIDSPNSISFPLGTKELYDFSISSQGRDIQCKVLYGNTLSFKGTDNLEIRPILRILSPVKDDVQFLFRIYNATLNFARLIRHRADCGNINVSIIADDSSFARIGTMFDCYQYWHSYDKKCPMHTLQYWEPFIPRLFQFFVNDDKLNLSYMPQGPFGFKINELNPRNFSVVFTAFEHECNLRKEIYANADDAPFQEIKDKVLKYISTLESDLLTEDQKDFIDTLKKRVSQQGTQMGQTAKLIHTLDVVYPILEEYFSYYPDYLEPKPNREYLYKFLTKVPVLRGKILHDGYSLQLDKDFRYEYLLLEIMVYAQMLTRAGLTQEEAKSVISYAYEFATGNRTFLTPD